MFFEVDQAKVIDKARIVQKGKEIYQSLLPDLEKSHKGHYIIIDVDSGDYLIDKISARARVRMQKKYPDTIFFAAKIGYPAMMNFN